MSLSKITILIILAGLLLGSLPASAGIFDSLPYRCKHSGDCNVCDFIQTFINLEQIVLGILGSLAILFFVYGGLKYILSHGNSESVASAQNVLINTVLGVALTLLAWVLVNFIVLAMTGQLNSQGVALIFDGKEWYRACVNN